MQIVSSSFSRRISEATQAVFGESATTRAVISACKRYEHDLSNIDTGRGIDALLIAIVGAKGQGKTWVARQLIKNDSVRRQLRSGDLIDDATTRLVWVGPVAPENMEPTSEIYYPCIESELVALGQRYVILDTPGLTDANASAAQTAVDSLSLAPIKLLVVARDQLRAAANITIAKQIEGSICIPIVSSVEPDEIASSSAAQPRSELDDSVQRLQGDLSALREQLQMLAPNVQLQSEILVSDFEISGQEQLSSKAFVGDLIERLSTIGLTKNRILNTKERRTAAAIRKLGQDVRGVIHDELPQLSDAVSQLNREADQLPERVISTLLGSESILETGIRMRLRAELISATSLLWFPYRTVMSTLNLTQGAWDRVMLALAGSVPSLFGALASWAKNIRQRQEVASELQDGIRKRTQEQVEDRLQPLCDQFHRAVLRMRPREERTVRIEAGGMRLMGIEELQTQSQRIFEDAIHRRATSGWLAQIYAVIGVLLFWGFMAGPIVLIYQEYISASVAVLRGSASELSNFPHPTPNLIFTSVLLSLLPLLIYCMIVLTSALTKSKVRRVAREIVDEHHTTVAELRTKNVIRLDFEDELLAQAEFLLNLDQHYAKET